MKKRLCFLTLALLTVAGLSSWAAQPKTNEEDGPFKIGDTSYSTLAEAINNVPSDGTITMTRNVSDAKGITVTSGKTFTVDFGGFTYTVGSPGAGSTGTETQAFQLLQGSTIVFKNGTINCSDANKNATWASDATSKGIAMIIQNYANLTLEDMTIDATNIAHNGTSGTARYAVSNNCGTIEFKGTTTINAPVAGDFAFDVCKSGSYAEPKVTWNSTGTVTGGIELTGGEFVVAKALALKQPIRTKDAPAKLTVNADITPDTDWNAGDALVIVNRTGDLTISGTSKISYNNTTNKTTGIYCAVKMTEADDVSTDSETNRAKLTVDGTVTLEGYQAGISGNGNSGRGHTDVTINGGTIKGCATDVDECSGIYQPQNGTLTINGGTIEGLVGVYVKSGSVTTAVKGGTIKGTGNNQPYSPSYNGFKVTGDAIVFDNCDYPGGEPNAEINGGTFTSVHGLAVASYAKEGKTPISPVINGGTFSDESAIKYAANGADINIVLQANRNASGIFLGKNRNIKLTFDLGGKTLNFVSPAVGSTGTENQAFHIEKGNQLFTLKNGKVTIDESAKNAYRFIIQNYNNLTVDGVELDGTNLGFESKTRYTVSNNSGTVEFKGVTSIKAASENGVAFDVCKYSNYDAPTVTVNTTGTITGHVEVTGGNLVVNSGTFSDLSGVQYVANGGTYKLANDVTISGALDINSGKKFVVDLNGKTLTGRTNIKHGNVTFVNGTINGGSNQALNVYGSSESAENYSVLTVANNVTVIADVYGVCLFGPQYNSTVGYGAVANINGTVKTTKDTSSNEGAVFVSGNLGSGQEIPSQSAMEGKNFVNITGSVTSKSDAALALNGSATVTIAESASLTGNTAIAAKRGKLVVNGGTITGNGACVGNPNGNGNGTELTGSALSASSTYGKHLTIDVKGGNFTSAAYTILNNSDDDACTFNISGGEFTTTKENDGIVVYARLGSVNITGGEFTNESNSEATLHVGCTDAVTYSKSPKLTISGGTVENKAGDKYPYHADWKALTVNMANQLKYKAVEISGGEFYGQSPDKDDSWTESNTEFTTFLKAGYAVKGSDNVWTVVPANASPVVANVSEVEITDEEGESLTLNEKEQTKVTETLTSATSDMTANTEISLVNEANELSVASGVVGEDQSVGITVELTGTKVSVATGEQTITATLKEFTFDVTPYVVTTSDKAVVSKIENNKITAPMTFRLPIPSSVTEQYARVYHKHDGKTTDLGLKQIQGTSPNKFIEISTTSFSEFAVKLTSEEVNKPTTLYYYAGSSTKVDGTPENFESAKATNANAIAFVDDTYADWASTQENVVVDYAVGKNGHYYECPNFVLTDWVSDDVFVDFYTPVGFNVVSGSYTRPTIGSLNSVCLPFAITNSDVNGKIGTFHSTSLYIGDELQSSGTIYFNEKSGVNGGVPCIVQPNNLNGWNIDLAGRTIVANEDIDNSAIIGSYATAKIGEGFYKVGDTSKYFVHTGNDSYVYAFRAYIDIKRSMNINTDTGTTVKELNIDWADDATGIENVKVASDSKVIYDLTGRMVSNPVKGGLYIINGKKVIFK